MDGKTHLKLGVTTSVAAAFVASAVLENNMALLSGLIAPAVSILTSQLPDLDSNKSDISQVVPIVKLMKSKMLFFVNFILTISFIFLKPNLGQTAYILAGVFGALCVIQIMSPIIFKHRGFLHSGVACALVGYLSYLIYHIDTKNILLLGVALGIGSGYICHIFYDSFTVRKCPLLWPLDVKNIGFGFTTSKKGGPIGMGVSYIFIILSVVFWFLR